MFKQLIKLTVSVLLVTAIAAASTMAFYAQSSDVTQDDTVVLRYYMLLYPDSPSPDTLMRDLDIRNITTHPDTENTYIVVLNPQTSDTVVSVEQEIQSFVKGCTYVKSFGVLPEGDCEIEEYWLRGDADGDGVLTIADATCVQRYLAGISKMINYEQAKVSRANCLSIIDATLIQMKLAKIIDDFY